MVGTHTQPVAARPHDSAKGVLTVSQLPGHSVGVELFAFKSDGPVPVFGYAAAPKMTGVVGVDGVEETCFQA